MVGKRASWRQLLVLFGSPESVAGATGGMSATESDTWSAKELFRGNSVGMYWDYVWCVQDCSTYHCRKSKSWKRRSRSWEVYRNHVAQGPRYVRLDVGSTV